jgi:hypothetical protein
MSKVVTVRDYGYSIEGMLVIHDSREKAQAWLKERQEQDPEGKYSIDDSPERLEEAEQQVKERAVERQQVEWVFGLTGGELDDEPLFCGGTVYHFHYDGIPEYAGEDFPDQHDNGIDYYTVVACFLHSKGVEEDAVPYEDYKLTRWYQSSGEAECPGRNCGSVEEAWEHEKGSVCYLCEADKPKLGEPVEDGNGHGYIYLGEGWCEVVFRRDTYLRCITCGQRYDPEEGKDGLCWDCQPDDDDYED